MIMEIFTVFDLAAARYLEPFFAPTVEVALRRFRQTVNQPRDDNPIALYPEDYTLYRIGAFNDTTGKMEGEELEKLATALEMVSNSRQVNQDNIEQLH